MTWSACAEHCPFGGAGCGTPEGATVLGARVGRALDWRPGRVSRRSPLSGVYRMPGEVKYPIMQSALEMCNFSWTPSLLEKEGAVAE